MTEKSSLGHSSTAGGFRHSYCLSSERDIQCTSSAEAASSVNRVERLWNTHLLVEVEVDPMLLVVARQLIAVIAHPAPGVHTHHRSITTGSVTTGEEQVGTSRSYQPPLGTWVSRP